jgi:hypothetical protein
VFLFRARTLKRKDQKRKEKSRVSFAPFAFQFLAPLRETATQNFERGARRMLYSARNQNPRETLAL